MSTCLRCFVAGGTCFVTCRQPWTSVFLSLFGRVFSRSHVMSQTLSVCDFCCARLKVHLDPALPTMCLAEDFERDLSTLRTKYNACHIFQNVSGKFSPPRWIRRGRWRGRLPRPNAQDRTKSVEDFWGKRWEKGTHQYALHPLKSLSLKCFEHKVWATLSNSESNAGWIWDWASDNAADTKWQVAQRHTNRDRLGTDRNSKMFFLFEKVTESHLGHFHFLHWRLQFGQSCTTFPHFCVRWFSTHAFYQLFHQLDSQFTVPF